jgi:transcription elongation GreA/GreB family factor
VQRLKKAELIQMMIKSLESDLEGLIFAAQATHEAATNEESKPENEYDTRALEASYLAGAQSKRAQEIEEALSYCRALKVKTFSKEDPISVSALVELQSENKTQIVLLMPKGGGLTLESNGLKVKVITGQSPLGQAIQGQKLGSLITVETAKDTTDYEITDLM